MTFSMQTVLLVIKVILIYLNFIDFVEGKGKRKGTIGKFIAVDSHGIQFGMPVMDNFKYLRENFDKMKKWVGRTATFKYFEKTKRGSYRHPLFKCLRNYE